MTILEILDSRIRGPGSLNKNQKVSCVKVQWLGKREIMRIGMGTLVSLDTILRSQNSQTLLNLPCPFCHPCLMKLVLPCLETSYFANEMSLLFCLIKTISPLLTVSLVSFIFPEHLSVSFILINTFACLWALDKCSSISSFLEQRHRLSDLSINVSYKMSPLWRCFLFLCSLQILSNMGSTLFIFFRTVTISLNYLFINPFYFPFCNFYSFLNFFFTVILYDQWPIVWPSVLLFTFYFTVSSQAFLYEFLI